MQNLNNLDRKLEVIELSIIMVKLDDLDINLWGPFYNQ